MKTIHRVRIENEFYIVVDSKEGDDPSLPYQVARDCLREFLRDTGTDDIELDVVEQVNELKRIPKEWRGCLPYGDQDDQETIDDILSVAPTAGEKS